MRSRSSERLATHLSRTWSVAGGDRWTAPPQNLKYPFSQKETHFHAAVGAMPAAKYSDNVLETAQGRSYRPVTLAPTWMGQPQDQELEKLAGPKSSQGVA